MRWPAFQLAQPRAPRRATKSSQVSGFIIPGTAAKPRCRAASLSSHPVLIVAVTARCAEGASCVRIIAGVCRRTLAGIAEENVHANAAHAEIKRHVRQVVVLGARAKEKHSDRGNRTEQRSAKPYVTEWRLQSISKSPRIPLRQSTFRSSVTTRRPKLEKYGT
jgi:hypothetical protein